MANLSDDENSSLSNEELTVLLSHMAKQMETCTKALNQVAQTTQALTSAMEAFSKLTNIFDDRIKYLESRKYN